MSSRLLGRARRVMRRFGNMTSAGALILLYHRVAEADSDPWSLCVTPQHFAEHLEVLRKYAYPMPLRQLNRALGNGKPAPRSIAITFDDGYADNLHHGKPLLEHYDVPATAFITSGYIGQTREFWWDELERLFLQPGTLPSTLCLDINGSCYQWELEEAAYYSEAEYQRHCGWQARQDPPSLRHIIYYTLWQLLGPLLDDVRRRILDALLEWSGAKPGSRPTCRPLWPEELCALRHNGLIEVGSHTETHPYLPSLPLFMQQDELRRSKHRLEEILGEPVQAFAYPYGDYTMQTRDLVQEYGFAYACATRTESIRRHTDRFQLPRFEVQNWDGDELAKRLSRWFHN